MIIRASASVIEGDASFEGGEGVGAAGACAELDPDDARTRTTANDGGQAQRHIHDAHVILPSILRRLQLLPQPRCLPIGFAEPFQHADPPHAVAL
jgi:hypothetical protein